MKSTHKVECFELKEFINHPNADLLKLVKIGETEYYYCANYEQWKDKLGQVVAWVPPESLVDTTREEFKFLGNEAKYYGDSFKASEFKRDEPTKYALIKGKRIRGILSYGLVVSVPDTFKVGDDAAEYLGVIHYERELVEEVKKVKNYSTGGEVAKAPPFDCPHYDVDALLKYYRYLQGKEVVALEKIEGCFQADALVKMSDLTEKRIEHINIGDKVLSFNEKTGFYENKNVINILVRSEVKNWIKLEFENGKKITCTPEHLILTKNGWKEAQKLTDEDDVLSF